VRGQWVGAYAGSNSGLAIVDIDEVGGQFRGYAYMYDSNQGLPRLDWTRSAFVGAYFAFPKIKNSASACFFVGCARDREYKNDPSASVIHDH
jgi:hypothetical protein